MVRVAGVYAVTTWAIFQVANTLFPVFNLPKWTLTLLAILLMLGLPVAMIIAWAFEAHPDGLRRAQPVGGPPRRFAAMDWVLVAATAAIIGIFTVQAIGLWSPPWRKAPAEGNQATSAAGDNSIAILPFANFSDSKDAEYFADGLTEEVINSLAKTRDLKIAGRTSSFYYKGKNHDLRQVGRQLGVAHVLELHGSAVRQGPEPVWPSVITIASVHSGDYTARRSHSCGSYRRTCLAPIRRLAVTISRCPWRPRTPSTGWD